MTKPITTIEIVSSVIGIIKTGAVIITMMILEFAKMEKAKAKLSEAIAINDLEIEKAKHEKTDKPDSVVVDEYIASKMLHGTPNINHIPSDKKS
jgi:hypothetical protein